MSCKLCLEFNENSFDFSSDDAIRKNIAEILRRHFPFCFEDGDLDGFVCEKCWWKVEIFNDFYNAIERIHQNTIFVEAEIELNQDSQLFAPPSGINAVKFEEPDCLVNEQNTEHQPSLIETAPFTNANIDSSSGYRCTVPGCRTKRRYPTKRKLRLHVREQHTKALCHKQQTKSNLNQAQNKVPQSKKRRNPLGSLVEHAPTFQCTAPHCPTKRCYPTQMQLDRHTREQHHRIPCGLCSKMYSKPYIGIHIKNVHSDNTETVCDICGMSCKTKASYKAHYATMHTVQDRIQCDLCGLWLKNKSYFRNHYVTVHLGSASGPVTCQICGHTSPNKKALESHERIHRPDYKSFFCTVCGKGFPNKTQHRDHMTVHSNARETLKCVNCCKEFNSKTGFRHHMCTTPVERNYKCPYCDRAYSYSSGVRTHIGRSHRAEEDKRKESIKLTKLANLENIKNVTQTF